MPRDPYPLPQHPDRGISISSLPKRITFLQPGYGCDAQPLLILPACDQNDTIDHELARIACAVVACNEFDGFFTTDICGNCRVYEAQLPFTEEGYFFHVPKQADQVRPYPVYLSFRHWSPPLWAQLPPPWRNCPIPDALGSSGRLTSVIAHNIIKRDGTCRITNYTEQTEAAHIIPDGESEWFQSRGLTRRAKMEDESNFLLLKVDVHKLWDQRQFTVVPRTVDGEKEKAISWVAYVLKRQPSKEVISLYHDVCLQPLTGVDVLFLFCRFAWTIFESLDVFLEQGSERWLMVRNPSTGAEEVVKYSPTQCRDQNFTRRGRSQSPKKIKRTASDKGERDGDEERTSRRWSRSSASLSGSDTPNTSFSSFDISGSESSRGRKRRRRELLDQATYGNLSDWGL